MESPIDMIADNFVQIFMDDELIKNPLNEGVDLEDVIQGNSFLHSQNVSHGFSPPEALITNRPEMTIINKKLG